MLETAKVIDRNRLRDDHDPSLWSRSPLCPGPLERRIDLAFRLVPPRPRVPLDVLAGLEGLVDLEKVLNFQAVILVEVVHVAQVLQTRVAGRRTDDLGVI